MRENNSKDLLTIHKLYVVLQRVGKITRCEGELMRYTHGKLFGGSYEPSYPQEVAFHIFINAA